MFFRIRFQGKDYLGIGSGRESMSITTEDDYIHGKGSYAHSGGGVVERFGTVIGTPDEIEVGEEVDAPKTADDFYDNLMVHSSWFLSQDEVGV